jgi:hypothetical protein
MNENAPKVQIGSRVPVALATELARMAEQGNRGISREIWAAIAEHVSASQESSSTPQTPEGVAVPAAAPEGALGES